MMIEEKKSKNTKELNLLNHEEKKMFERFYKDSIEEEKEIAISLTSTVKSWGTSTIKFTPSYLSVSRGRAFLFLLKNSKYMFKGYLIMNRKIENISNFFKNEYQGLDNYKVYFYLNSKEELTDEILELIKESFNNSLINNSKYQKIINIAS